MGATAAHIGPALAVSPFQVGSLTEDEAYAQFVRIRFAENGGKPTCNHCGCDAVYEFKSRRIFKCKKCLRQFSATSKTPWSSRKLSFKQILYLVSRFAHGAQPSSMREISRDLNVQYKTGFVWCHKLRDALVQRASEEMLSGEVEVDGGYFGGHIRPKNLAKTRKDHRKVPYRASDRVLVVNVAWQRGGPIRTWVGRSESDPRIFMFDAIAPGTELFADSGNAWGAFRTAYPVHTINHQVAYSTPEACTNGAESYMRALRGTEYISRHISQHYLDYYAADAGWRVVKNRGKADVALLDLMSCMSKPGRSPLTGYFQGLKRTLPLCQPDGSTKGWSPQTKLERDKVRSNEEVTGIDSLGIRRSPERKKRWNRGFTFLSAESVLENTDLLPKGPGVYLIFLKAGRQLLEPHGFTLSGDERYWSIQDSDHLYTGETYGLRDRILDHLTGNTEVSTLRGSILALAHAKPNPSGPAILEDREKTEAALSEWLSNGAVVGFKSCGYVRDEEMAILESTPSPLNVKGRRTPFAAHLSEKRKRFFAEVEATWSPPKNNRWRR